jgi:hypothetical protein
MRGVVEAAVVTDLACGKKESEGVFPLRMVLRELVMDEGAKNTVEGVHHGRVVRGAGMGGILVLKGAYGVLLWGVEVQVERARGFGKGMQAEEENDEGGAVTHVLV